MKKIGVTSSGSIIVEMSQAHYDALAQIQTSPEKAQPEDTKMTTTQRVAFVKERIIKLKPKKKDGVVRSIAAMFQFTGGIEEQEIEKIIRTLQKEEFLHVEGNGKVLYK